MIKQNFQDFSFSFWDLILGHHIKRTNEGFCLTHFLGQLIEKCKTVAEQVSVKDSTVQPPHQEEGNKVESKSRAIENW